MAAPCVPATIPAGEIVRRIGVAPTDAGGAERHGGVGVVEHRPFPVRVTGNGREARRGELGNGMTRGIEAQAASILPGHGQREVSPVERGRGGIGADAGYAAVRRLGELPNCGRESATLAAVRVVLFGSVECASLTIGHLRPCRFDSWTPPWRPLPSAHVRSIRPIREGAPRRRFTNTPCIR